MSDQPQFFSNQAVEFKVGLPQFTWSTGSPLVGSGQSGEPASQVLVE